MKGMPSRLATEYGLAEASARASKSKDHNAEERIPKRARRSIGMQALIEEDLRCSEIDSSILRPKSIFDGSHVDAFGRI